MRIKNIFLAIFITLLATLVACQSPFTQATPTAILLPTLTPQPSNGNAPVTEDEVPRISVSEAKAALDSGQAILVDVRSADSYAAGHAKGAVSIPLANFESDIQNLSLEKSQWIITYCT